MSWSLHAGLHQASPPLCSIWLCEKKQTRPYATGRELSFSPFRYWPIHPQLPAAAAAAGRKPQPLPARLQHRDEGTLLSQRVASSWCGTGTDSQVSFSSVSVILPCQVHSLALPRVNGMIGEENEPTIEPLGSWVDTEQASESRWTTTTRPTFL